MYIYARIALGLIDKTAQHKSHMRSPTVLKAMGEQMEYTPITPRKTHIDIIYMLRTKTLATDANRHISTGKTNFSTSSQPVFHLQAVYMLYRYIHNSAPRPQRQEKWKAVNGNDDDDDDMCALCIETEIICTELPSRLYAFNGN